MVDRAFSRLLLPAAPVKLVAVVERGSSALFASEHAQNLLTEGRSWAAEMNDELTGGEALWSLATIGDTAQAQSTSRRSNKAHVCRHTVVSVNAL